MRTVSVIAVALVMSSSVGSAQQGAILLREAYTYPVAAGSNAHVFLAIDNFSTLPLAILRTSTSDALAVSSIGLGAEGSAGEQVASAFFVAAGRSIRMAPEWPPPSLLLDVGREFKVGDRISLTLHALGDFEIPVRVTVRPPPGTVGVAFGKSQLERRMHVTS
ncbi:MAG: hypothetical protein IPK33_08885 [Gemmatimonadetes bacterium]|nr:hypothetical protein [Gemmatimonadota bacterium]